MAVTGKLNDVCRSKRLLLTEYVSSRWRPCDERTSERSDRSDVFPVRDVDLGSAKTALYLELHCSYASAAWENLILKEITY